MDLGRQDKLTSASPIDVDNAFSSALRGPRPAVQLPYVLVKIAVKVSWLPKPLHRNFPTAWPVGLSKFLEMEIWQGCESSSFRISWPWPSGLIVGDI